MVSPSFSSTILVPSPPPPIFLKKSLVSDPLSVWVCVLVPLICLKHSHAGNDMVLTSGENGLIYYSILW